jgi:hypothetical protein
MARYWSALEAAWSVDLDLRAGDSAVFIPEPMTRAAAEPFADWGDPWKAGLERLAEKRERCEELFGQLRTAEAALEEARGMAEAAELEEREGAEAWASNVADEAKEYAIAGAILELDCARLSAYHELAAGQDKAAADIALIGRSVLDSVRRAQRAVPDPRARKNGDFLLFVHYELRLRWLARRVGDRLRRFLGEKASLATLAMKAASMAGLWEPRRGRTKEPQE